MSERLSDLDVSEYANNGTPVVQALAREVQERRKNDWANDLADLRLSADMLNVRDLCIRHDITVEGVVALVDEVMTTFAPYPYNATSDRAYLRRLARGEEA